MSRALRSAQVDGAAPRARRLAPDERREQILRVAVDSFRGHPYDEVSLDQIAGAAGITRGLINHHFGTKRELYVEVVRHLMDFPELPVPEYVQGATLRSRLEESVSRWLAAIERNRELWLASISMADIGDPEITAIIEDSRETGARRAAEVMGLGPVADLSPERMGMLRAWQALSEAAARQWLVYDRLSREQVELLVVETAVRAAEGLLDEMAVIIGERAAPQPRARRSS
jgi:AcrR family transcriptional regulator